MMRFLFTPMSLMFLYFATLDISRRSIYAQTYDNMTALKQFLYTGYDRHVTPVLNQSHILNVTVTFSLITIPEVDIINSFIKLTANLYCSWMDEKLTWVPAHYGDIQELSLPADKVWTPPVFLASGVTLENIVKSWYMVSVDHTGFSRVALGGAFNGICGFSIAFWPFDKQACNLYFVPFGPGPMQFIFPSKPVYINNFIQMGEWTYDQISASYQDRFDNVGKSIIYTVKIRRQSAFYILTLILPLFGVSFLGLLVFLIPCDSGERIGFAITITLTMVVFMTIVKDEVPKSSEPLPYMCIYITAIVCVAFLVNIINLFSLNLFYRNEAQPVGPKYKYFVKLVSRLNRERTVKPEETENSNKDNNPEYLTNTAKKKLDDHLQENTGPAEEDYRSNQNIESDIVTWKDVSNATDKVSFVIITPIVVLATVVGLVYLQVASDYPDWAK